MLLFRCLLFFQKFSLVYSLNYSFPTLHRLPRGRKWPPVMLGLEVCVSAARRHLEYGMDPKVQKELLWLISKMLTMYKKKGFMKLIPMSVL